MDQEDGKISSSAEGNTHRLSDADSQAAFISSSETTVDAVDPMIGYLLDGRYELLEAIGSGGMSIVYKARLNNVNKLFALKTLNFQVQAKDNIKIRFAREIDLLLKLEHPHIVSVQDCLYGPNCQPYLVMDLLRGVTLEQEVARAGALPWERVRKIMIQVCAAVKYAHQHQIVHRDLKPGNIMLLENEVDFVKVLDFGLALIGENTRKITQSGEFWGSPPYASPEQVKGNNTADQRSDIYSLGCVMYELLSGKDPFHGAGLYELLSKHVNEKPAPLVVTNPDVKVPHEMEQIVFKCLEKKPEDRFQSVAELQMALENLLSASGQIVSSSEIKSVSKLHGDQSKISGDRKSEPSSNSMKVVLAAVVVILVLIIGGLFLTQTLTEKQAASQTSDRSADDLSPSSSKSTAHTGDSVGSLDSASKYPGGKAQHVRKPESIAKVAPTVRAKNVNVAPSFRRDTKAALRPVSRQGSRSNSRSAATPTVVTKGDPFARLREHMSAGAKSE